MYIELDELECAKETIRMTSEYRGPVVSALSEEIRKIGVEYGYPIDNERHIAAWINTANSLKGYDGPPFEHHDVIDLLSTIDTKLLKADRHALQALLPLEHLSLALARTESHKRFLKHYGRDL